MQKLTKAEEEIMYHVWALERCTVSDVIARLGTPKPPHSTISSIMRILEKKDFLGHKSYGRTHEYFPRIEKKDYSKNSLKNLVKNYFDGSMNKMVSFLVEENDLSLEDLGELIEKLEKENDDD